MDTGHVHATIKRWEDKYDTNVVRFMIQDWLSTTRSAYNRIILTAWLEKHPVPNADDIPDSDHVFVFACFIAEDNTFPRLYTTDGSEANAFVNKHSQAAYCSGFVLSKNKWLNLLL